MHQGPHDLGTHSLAFLEQLYARWADDPESVDPEWRSVFEQEAKNRVKNGHVQLGPSFGLRSIFNPSGDGSGPANGGAAALAAVEATDRVPFLRRLALFEDLPTDELETVARLATEESVSDGNVFVTEGGVGTDMFVVTEGTVIVRRAGRLVAELGPGEVVGELAVLDNQPRVADAMARGEVKLLRIPGEDFLALLEKRPHLARGIVRVLSRRLRDSGTRQDRVDQLIRAYRVRGHLIASLDPLGLPKEIYPELNPAYYGFVQADLDMLFSSTTIPGSPTMRLRDIIAHLQKTYCGPIGVQFMHIDDLKVKMWLQNKMETTQNTCRLSQDEQVRILTKLTDAEIFEQFLHKKFIGAKRFSLEGAESLIPLLDLAIEKAGEHGLRETVIGMAHRGRLNVLVNVLGKSASEIFREFDDSDPEMQVGSGDVKYHLGHSSDRMTQSGNRIHISLSFNPSHLEFVNPVVLGRVRAKQDRFGDADRSRCMGILIHGDASFAGQGVVQETLNLSELHGYRTGGTLHIVVNNQIGFTTNPSEGRSSHYATDVAKMLQIPVFHVNGENPEAVAQVINLAMEFREEFKKDVVIDMYCYRRYGHNEGDEPAFTQPLLYKAVRKRKSVREGYLDNLYHLGEITKEAADQIAVERRELLEDHLSAARSEAYDWRGVSSGEGVWRSFRSERDADVDDVDTGVARSQLVRLAERINAVPGAFTPHPKILKLLEHRREVVLGGRDLDWGMAEGLAFASLLAEGNRVRISGQDSQRGTFSHRHAVLNDFENGKRHIPYRHISPEQGLFDVWNSPLSEVGVLGFEYGYSLDYPEALVVWEAQFGDFANVAQVIVDQFISSGQDKWNRWSGLVLLLPHGFEGQGPEHSSARLERFLTLASEDNIQVVNPTTPAQIFHALRRQVLRPNRKPLVVMSPKSLLRHPRAVSKLEELTQGTFSRFIPDTDERVRPKDTQRILLTSGKLFYDLEAERERRQAFHVAIVRVEQYYPLRIPLLEPILAAYPDETPICWVQEEPWNMGAWSFMRLRFGERVLGRFPLRGITRPESASPATGSASTHKWEQQMLLDEAFAETCSAEA